MRKSFIFFLFAFFAFPVFAQRQPAELTVEVPKTFQFAVYGDIRFTDSANTKASNPELRRDLVQQIASLRPKFLLVSGDLVFKGSNESDWAIWDAETKPWTEQGIPIFPTIGNHEVRGDPAEGLRNYFRRFPDLSNSRYYSVRAANVLTLVLDSSQAEFSLPQQRWLADQLDHLPDDIDFVFFLLHHPPYTKTRDYWHSPRPSEQDLAKMLEKRQAKTRARFVVFSGHVHNYERYEHHGVTYIVTGGGGATPYTIPRGSKDAYQQPGPTYHYCLVDVNGPKIEISMMKLELRNGQPVFTKADSMLIINKEPLPAAKAAVGR